MKTIQKRVEELEETMPKNTNHKYEMFIYWDKKAEYFRDGEPITRAEFFREARTDEINVAVDWGNDENDKITN